ncbi:hypothetical protein [Lactovum odontotermitis]
MDERTSRINRERQLEQQLREYNRQSKKIEEQLARNKQTALKNEKEEERRVDSYQRQVNALEQLSQRWKGRDAQSFMAECLQEENRFHRQRMFFIREKHQQISLEGRKLYSQQQAITKASRQLTSEERKK